MDDRWLHGPAELVAARAAAASVAARFAQSGVALHAAEGPPLYVLADPDRLAEALDELLGNSRHHCEAGDDVTITAVHRGRTADLTVTDTGSGFDSSEAEHIFQWFYRGDPAPGNPTGSGIGLTVARAPSSTPNTAP
ncbi:MAG TPA: ATP-binding protein [Motilibacterales bacterium]|nr:ATP-binding protein [Motilibacterales bacterium]